jgi:nucleoside-diphosphate-sugar epimerase
VSRILIAGCGYVGQATAELFHQAGWEVQGWTRSPKSAAAHSGKPYQVSQVDIAERARVKAYPENFDAIILCPSTRGGGEDVYRQVYLNGARSLLARFTEATVVFTSSTSVYGQNDGALVTEQSATEPVQETSRILLQTEKAVLDCGGIVARVAGIYGPGRSALLRKFLAGEATRGPDNDRFINQVHRDDIAGALFLLVTQKLSAGQIYNVVDDCPILRSQCYLWLAAKLGRPAPPIGKSISKGRRGRSNKRVSNAKLRALGWSLRYPSFADGMEQSVLSGFTV